MWSARRSVYGFSAAVFLLATLVALAGFWLERGWLATLAVWLGLHVLLVVFSVRAAQTNATKATTRCARPLILATALVAIPADTVLVAALSARVLADCGRPSGLGGALANATGCYESAVDGPGGYPVAVATAAALALPPLLGALAMASTWMATERRKADDAFSRFVTSANERLDDVASVEIR
jgi:hypothetical protein